MSNLGDLFLKDQETKCFFSDLLHLGCKILDVLWAFLRINVILVNICRQRTGTINGSNSRDINDVVWLYTLGKVLGTRLGELECAYEVALVENIFIYSRVIKIDNIGMKMLIIEVLDLLESWLDA
jgi:hypothetical protein